MALNARITKFDNELDCFNGIGPMLYFVLLRIYCTLYPSSFNFWHHDKVQESAVKMLTLQNEGGPKGAFTYYMDKKRGWGSVESPRRVTCQRLYSI